MINATDKRKRCRPLIHSPKALGVCTLAYVHASMSKHNTNSVQVVWWCGTQWASNSPGLHYLHRSICSLTCAIWTPIAVLLDSPDNREDVPMSSNPQIRPGEGNSFRRWRANYCYCRWSTPRRIYWMRMRSLVLLPGLIACPPAQLNRGAQTMARGMNFGA